MIATAPTPARIFKVIQHSDEGFTAHGGGQQLWDYKGPEAMLAGPAETGKTITALWKLHALMWAFPGSQAAIIRKTRATMVGTVLATYEKKVLKGNPLITKFGGKNPEWYDYPNGSRVYVGGMDDPGKVLSSERDFIYVNQSEELDLADWETLTTRATGRAGNSPYAQVFGDCNPGPATHWILQRASAGSLKFFESRHEDNPTLFNQVTGEITEQGRRTLEVLDNLTGVRKQRLRYGRWVGAEGQVYEDFDRAIHVIDPFPIPEDWARYRCTDFGYVNPFVTQWWAESPDGALYMYRELYGTSRIVDDWANDIIRLSQGEHYQTSYADHDAEDRATLDARGITTEPASKEVSPGIQTMQARLRKQGPDNKPRIFFFREVRTNPRDETLAEKHLPTCTVEEFDGYVWAIGKEVPLKKNDHGLDTTRYMCQSLEYGGIEVFL